MRVLLRKIKNKVVQLCNNIYYVNLFKKYDISSCIRSPLKIDGPENICIGKHTTIQYKTWLAALPLTGNHGCELNIGSGTIIGHFNHIYATKCIIIEDNVLTADKVYISDNLHEYQDIMTPIIQQPIKQNNSVIIGSGTWIGENACILGVHIGKNCVIGANAVVTKNIPDYSVVVGAPARIIKRYDIETDTWKKTNKIGNFID